MPQATRLSDLKSTSFLGGHISAEPWAGSDLPAVPPKPPELALPAVPPKPPELALPAVPPKPPELALPAVPPKPPEPALPAVSPKPTQENAPQIATRPAKLTFQKLRAETVPRQQQWVNPRRITEPPQKGIDEFSAIRMQPPSALRPGAPAVRPRVGEPNSAMEARMRFMSPATVFGVSSSEAAKFSDLQPMNPRFKGEERGEVFGTSVKYLNMQDRAGFKVTIRDGKVFDADGKPFETRQASTAFEVNKGRAIFVMDAQGSIYISNEQTRGKFHHSSFLAGQPVAAAGDIRIENGVITAISRKSGHYRPTLEQLNQVVQQLADQNVSGIFVDEDLS
jgi:hypothetical protein